MIQVDFLDSVNSLKFQSSDMFENVPNPEDNSKCLLLANLPQSPFQNSGLQPNKNGGSDSLKFNSKLLKYFSCNYVGSNSTLIMNYCHFSNPKIFFGIFD